MENKKESDISRRNLRFGSDFSRRLGSLLFLVVFAVGISVSAAPFVQAKSQRISVSIGKNTVPAADSIARFQLDLSILQNVQEDARDSSSVTTIEDFNLLLEDSKYSSGLYAIASFDETLPALVFVPGANSPPDTFNKYMQNFQGRYNMFIFFYNYLDRLNETAGFLNQELKRSTLITSTANVVFIAHSFGNNILMRTVLDSEESSFFKRCQVIRLTPTVAGSRKACNASRKFRQFFMGFVSLLPQVKDYREIAAAQDPLGVTIQSLVSGFDHFKDKVNVVHTFAVLGDSHSPSKDSSILFRENYSQCILSEALILEPKTNHPHVEVLYRQDVIDAVDVILSEVSMDAGGEDTSASAAGMREGALCKSDFL
jgi:hypothetical protein